MNVLLSSVDVLKILQRIFREDSRNLDLAYMRSTVASLTYKYTRRQVIHTRARVYEGNPGFFARPRGAPEKNL